MIMEGNMHYNNRLKYLDYTKGFAILLMLLAHCMGNNNLLHNWIFSFHMPIFFVVCGCLTTMKYDGRQTGFRDFQSHLIKRLKQIGVPYIVFCLVLIAFYFSLSLLSHSDYNILESLFSVVTLKGIDSLWFLPVYFLSEMLFVFVFLKFNKIFRCCISFAIIIGLFFAETVIPDIGILKLILKVLVSLVFVYSGYIIFKYILDKINTVFSLLLLLIGSILQYFNGFVAIGSLELNNVFLFYINAILLSLAVMSLFKNIENKTKSEIKLLSYFGKNSIVVLCTNNLLIEILRMTDHFITKDILITLGYLGVAILFIILCVLEVLVIKISDTKLCILFGKKDKTTNF